VENLLLYVKLVPVVLRQAQLERAQGVPSSTCVTHESSDGIMVK
jgi:hypothetical protein